MEIRRLERRDIKAVMDIANHFITHTNATWQREARPRAYYRKWALAHQGRYPAFVAVQNGGVVGYASLSPFRAPTSGFDHICENSVYVIPDAQNNGVGGALMITLIEEARRQGFWAITAWVDSENTFSMDFHKKYGFYETGMMKNIGNKDGRRLTTCILQMDIQ